MLNDTVTFVRTYDKNLIKAAERNNVDFNKLINKPMITSNKDQIIGMVLAEFNDKSKGRTIENIRAINNNYIILDIDNGMTIEDTEKLLIKKDYTYWLYTTFNHGYKDTDRFRIIIKANVYNFDFTNDDMRKHFVIAMSFEFSEFQSDICSYDINRIQYMPAHRPNDSKNYYCNSRKSQYIPIIDANKYSPDFQWMSTAKLGNKFDDNKILTPDEVIKRLPKVAAYFQEYSDKKTGNNGGYKLLFTAICSALSITKDPNHLIISMLKEHAIIENSWTPREFDKNLIKAAQYLRL